jgi:hypothetical protein
MRANQPILFLVVLILLLSSCKKTMQYPTSPLSDYLPLQSGKYIIYRTDSTVFTNFGVNTEIHSYEEKQVVDSQITDGLGRPGYRIYTFLRDTDETQPWTSSGTYIIIPLSTSAEVIENNMRVIKLALPFTQNYTWQGNSFLPDDPYDPTYKFSNDDDINSWTYTYPNIDTTIVLNGQTINNVLEVNGINESTNVPITDVNGYASLNFQQEYYAKGIGLVSQELVMWEYQPARGPGTFASKVGFGVKRTMLNHN